MNLVATVLAALPFAAALVAGVGVALIISAAVGVARLPDTYTRLHAASKAAALGAGAVIVAAATVAAHAGDGKVAIKLLAAAALVVVVGPIGGHSIARGALRAGIPLDERTEVADRR